jgi:hypothetical protein
VGRLSGSIMRQSVTKDRDWLDLGISLAVCNGGLANSVAAGG